MMNKLKMTAVSVALATQGLAFGQQKMTFEEVIALPESQIETIVASMSPEEKEEFGRKLEFKLPGLNSQAVTASTRSATADSRAADDILEAAPNVEEEMLGGKKKSFWKRLWHDYLGPAFRSAGKQFGKVILTKASQTTTKK